MVSPYSGKNWQLIVAGILFVLFSAVCLFFPGLTLGSITFMIGAAFVLSGAVHIASYIRDRDVLNRFDVCRPSDGVCCGNSLGSGYVHYRVCYLRAHRLFCLAKSWIFSVGLAFNFWCADACHGYGIFLGARNVCNTDRTVRACARCLSHCSGSERS